MKTLIKMLAFLVLVSVSQTSCSSDGSTSPDGDGNGNGDGSNTISMTMDGANWSNATAGGATYTDSSGFYGLGINGTNGNQTVTLSIIAFAPVTTGSYTNSTGFIGGFIDTSPSTFALTDPDVGVSNLQLSKFDLTNKRVSGTFDMVLQDALNNRMITITNGKFTDVPLVEEE